MGSPQTLSQDERRLVASWAADCAERVLEIFESMVPQDDRPRSLIERTRAFARGEVGTAEAIRLRFAGGVPADDVTSPAAAAAARSAGQAVAVCHMGAHGLGAAAYAVRAASLAEPDSAELREEEIRWQLDQMSDRVRVALRALPALSENPAGPLGPGLLSRGDVGSIIRRLQAELAERSS